MSDNGIVGWAIVLAVVAFALVLRWLWLESWKYAKYLAGKTASPDPPTSKPDAETPPPPPTPRHPR